MYASIAITVSSVRKLGEWKQAAKLKKKLLKYRKPLKFLMNREDNNIKTAKIPDEERG
jgi:hypothetical protein